MFRQGFRRGVTVCVFAGLVSAGLVACMPNDDMPDAPKPVASAVATGSCKDSLGTTWTITPSEVTVGAGDTVHFKANRNGSLYTPGPGSPVVHYSAPDGGTLADPDGIETDYVAGAVPGDYSVELDVGPAGAPADGSICKLTAIVHVVAGAPKQPVQGRLIAFDQAGASAWTFSEDANRDDPAPSLKIQAQSATSISVSYDGSDGMKCGCNAEHKVIPLGRSYDCATSVVELDYAGGGSFGYTSSQSISIRFCKDGQCSDQGFYGGDAIVASQQTGHSNCAWQTGNSFPAAPQLKSGHNVFELGKLQKGLNGSCSGSFDTIDVHVQAYACFKDKDSGSQTLSNLVIR